MEPVALGFGAVLLMGLVFGAGPCNLACLPYLGPVFFGRARPWRQVLSFSLGRIAGYVGSAAAAGAVGQAATRALEGRGAAMVLGLATVLAGIVMFLRRRQGACAGGRTPSRQPPRMLPLALFTMGAGMALNPCVPLATVLLAAAATATPWNGAWLGFGFGLGAVVVPTFLFGWAMARFGLEIRARVGRWRAQLERGAGALLISLGVFTLLGWVHP
jgi:thiol:disulfide interchange protein DsbD